MRLSARFVAILLLQSLLTAFAFAGDDAKPAAKSRETAAGDSAGAATEPATTPPATNVPQAQPAASSGSSLRGPDTPGGEVFFGYSYVRMATDTRLTPTATVNEHFQYIPGGSASITGNINNWFGVTGEFGTYSLNDVGRVDGRLWTFLAGPRFSFSHKRWTPYIQALVGGARLSSSFPTGFVSDAPFFNSKGPNFHQNAFAASTGLGLDWHATRHFSVRLGEIDYLFTRFNDNRDNRQNNLRASAGLVFRFGYPSAPPPPVVHHPPTASCVANPATVHLDTTETSTIHAEASSPDNSPLTYSWSATGGAVDGSGPTVRWSPGQSPVGKYTVTANVKDAQGLSASCSADVAVEPRPNRPPVCSLAATNVTPRARNVVMVGDKVRIAATASDPDNDPITYKWTSSGGQVTGTGNTVQLDTSTLRQGRYTVTLTVDDGRGGTGQCAADLNLAPKLNVDLRSVYFQTAQPTPKNPTGGLLASQQATLQSLANDFKAYVEFDPKATLTLVGHTDPRGGPTYNQALSDRRVASAKSFLVEHGVPADSIKTQGVGEEHQLTPAEVKQMTEADTQVTAEQKARILKNLKVITLAQNRRVDVVLNAEEKTESSTKLYPFNAADAASLLNPKGAAGPKKPAPKPGAKPPAKKGPAPAPSPAKKQ
jgi:outer membrane protein OmpA-like peptidoglycan-associated protein